MTTMGSRDLARTLASLAAGGCRPAPLPPGTTLVLAWPILPRAILDVPALAALFPPSASRPTAIEWRLSASRAVAHVAVGEARVAVPACDAEARWELHPESLLWSVDAALGTRTLLTATIAPGEPPRALYARTSLFLDFDIPAGRFGPPAAHLAPE